MVEYNPFKDFNPAFTVYKPVERKEVKIDFPLYDSPDVSDMFSYVSSSGKPVSSANTPKSEESLYDILSELGKGHYEGNINEISSNNGSMKQNLSEKLNMAFKYFQNKVDNNGNRLLLDYQIAGLLGNIFGESNYDEKAINKGSGAYGLALWLGPRLKLLYATYGKNPTFELQLDFIWWELNNTEKGAFRLLLNSKNVEESTRAIMESYERPSKKEQNESFKRRLTHSLSLLS